MLRHFLNATARTSSSWLFAKPNAPVYVSSTRSLFNKPCSGGHLFSSTARTSSLSLFVQPNAPVYVSSLRSLSGQKLCASEKYLKSGAELKRELKQLRGAAYKSFSRVVNTICYAYVFCFLVTLLISGRKTFYDFRVFSLDELNEKTSRTSSLYLLEYVQANEQYEKIKGSGMPQDTFFWRRAIVIHEQMSGEREIIKKLENELNEMLDDCKREGIRVEESENYCFVITTSESEKARIAERIAKLRDIRRSHYKLESPSALAALLEEIHALLYITICRFFGSIVGITVYCIDKSPYKVSVRSETDILSSTA